MAEQAKGVMKFNPVGKRFYETGIRKLALFLKGTGQYEVGAPWNGATNVKVSPSGAEPNKHYSLNEEYINILSAEELAITIEAFTYPDIFAACDGSQEVEKGVFLGGQEREAFGIVWQSLIGNDIEKQNYGYVLHLVWDILAAPAEREYATTNATTDPITLSWECSVTPATNGEQRVTEMTIRSDKADPVKLKALEDVIYGTETAAPKMPSFKEVITMMKGAQG